MPLWLLGLQQFAGLMNGNWLPRSAQVLHGGTSITLLIGHNSNNVRKMLRRLSVAYGLTKILHRRGVGGGVSCQPPGSLSQLYDSSSYLPDTIEPNLKK